ncbi:MAG: Rrf2 family transcriptional regulator [Lachnospiraceae bacterium]|nr:Rrf2 family transcriptional regulator [Lachnospiraceae bacterium]MDD3659887.1 Rrf2 family transcriptional regulator [Lachnospiraceae bacterium]
MKISTRGRYALRLMIDLAEQYEKGYITLNDISLRLNISKKYLEQIIPPLTRKGLLLTTRGALGGYQLSRTPAEITVEEILVSAEGNLFPVNCMKDNPNLCEFMSDCETLPIWEGLYNVISNYLKGITLQDILNQTTSSN